MSRPRTKPKDKNHKPGVRQRVLEAAFDGLVKHLPPEAKIGQIARSKIRVRLEGVSFVVVVTQEGAAK